MNMRAINTHLRQEEEELLKDNNLKEGLAQSGYPQVYNYLIYRYALKYAGHDIPLPDLIKEGINEAEKALNDYRPEKGFRLNLYLSWRLRQRFNTIIGGENE